MHIPNKITIFQIIVVILPCIILSSLLAYARGFFGQGQLTAHHFVNQLESNNGIFSGYRRNHAKGMCISGYFIANGNATTLTKTPILKVQAKSQVIGRLSIPGGNPAGLDEKAPLRSMALQIRADNGEEWRTGMNSSSVFPVSTPEAFFQQLQAMQPDSLTGKLNPEKLQQFFAAHPETKNFRDWVKNFKPSSSFSNTYFNSLNSFEMSNEDGQNHIVRWSLEPESSYSPLSENVAHDPDFLFHDLQTRLQSQPLEWKLVIHLAQPGDVIDDATQAWSESNPSIDAGKLVITSAAIQNDGACRDINFDPLVLPSGIAPSTDPLLDARSSVYSESVRRRLHEQNAIPKTISTQR